jgi:glucose-6-phosphate isomerase
VGALIALFERAVGFYASLVHINAYHQPGVEAGKQAAASILNLQKKLLSALTAAPQSAEELASAAGGASAETVALILEHLAANGRARAVAGDQPKFAACS